MNARKSRKVALAVVGGGGGGGGGRKWWRWLSVAAKSSHNFDLLFNPANPVTKNMVVLQVMDNVRVEDGRQ
ncbi:hypothetical protein C5167_005522 [Papaver somniferum]|uniref:Uncharacterized protein n=1 Tax=Papaver somniferum TaxID=3469 RepID=A0A4Y7JAR2_PAPSO|nr:hypothetical protein C5167_005522 [Papaver somniferum]